MYIFYISIRLKLIHSLIAVKHTIDFDYYSLVAGVEAAALHLHAVLLYVWQHCWDKAVGVDVACPTERFVMLNGLKISGGVAVRRAHEITGVLAQLKHNMRLVAVYEMGTNGTVIDRCRPWLVDDHASPFTYVCNMQSVATTIAMSAQEMPKVVWPSDGDVSWLTYAGTDVSLAALQQVFAGMETRMKELWSKLTLNITVR